jgi:3-methyladenine DNA glycosylase AlkD
VTRTGDEQEVVVTETTVPQAAVHQAAVHQAAVHQAAVAQAAVAQAEVMAELAALEDPKTRQVNEARTPKVHDWLVDYVVKKNPHAEALRVAWSADPDPVVASAGWALTSERVTGRPQGLDLAGLLDVIEAQLKGAPDRLQWAMNHRLAQIGIEHAGHRARAVDIGERLEVLKDYPTPPNCTSPYAPSWIGEMVRRHDAAR